MAASAREKVHGLIAKKDAMEKEIKELQQLLVSEGNVGMTGPLIDAEGYPRNDIDVYSVRTARHNIICLQNDHKSLMTEIEEGLHELHGLERQRREQGIPAPKNGAKSPVDHIPFAKVDQVSEGSPAEKAGLCLNDQVVEFGSVSTANFKSLHDIGTVVKHSTGQSVRVVVLRDGKEEVLSLVPQSWSGRGLLGCNIVPVRK